MSLEKKRSPSKKLKDSELTSNHEQSQREGSAIIQCERKTKDKLEVYIPK